MNTDNRKQISKRKQFKTIFVFSYFILPYVKLPILKMMHLPITLTDVSVLVHTTKKKWFIQDLQFFFSFYYVPNTRLGAYSSNLILIITFR